ncbi:MAG: pseudouridine synthase [Bowdeniella nasicola]|nr:pseudouridine synthase [Bowdeniella nasicola]
MITFLQRALAAKRQCSPQVAYASALRALANRAVTDLAGNHLSSTHKAGSDTLWVTRPIVDGPPPHLPVCYRTEHITVVNKPAGIATTPRGSYIARSAVVAARTQFHNPTVIAAHRLDRLTSGALLLVHSAQLRGRYQQLFARAAVTKTYCAVTTPPRRPLPAGLDTGNITAISLPLIKPAGHLQVRVDPHGTTTHTRIQLRRATNTAWWWRVWPTGGMQHQIRVVFHHLGIPIMHDPLYPEVLPPYAPQWYHGLALHAEELAFTDPLSGEDVCVQAPLNRKLAGEAEAR